MVLKMCHHFNLAMLGKQGWKLLTNPDAIFTRVFKSRYFPQGDFLGARLGHNPSYIWRSIFASQVIVKKGIRWCVGNGTRINVWKDPWLRRLGNPYISSHTPPRSESLMVKDLIDFSTGRWDLPTLSALFHQQDLQAIQTMPLLHLNKPDMVTWTLNRKGIYTCNTDAAIFKDTNSYSFAFCLRDNHGRFKAATTGWYHGLSPRHEAEVIACIEAMSWLTNSSYENVLIELDCKTVVDDLHGSNQLLSEYGLLIQKGRSILASHKNLSVRFIRRQANHVAHSLARAARSYASPHTFDFIPPCITSLIMKEMN
uniref:RNase H type-1 domain-containing protein n=1 Tax=Cajanus cajan TaxID=3821 RepID=A0A151SBS5_CAJCA|nr:hypothetical protein KK1_025927 [Cajanus cajan]